MLRITSATDFYANLDVILNDIRQEVNCEKERLNQERVAVREEEQARIGEELQKSYDQRAHIFDYEKEYGTEEVSVEDLINPESTSYATKEPLYEEEKSFLTPTFTKNIFH